MLKEILRKRELPDFKTREDAVEYLKDIRKSIKSAMIVPSEIFVRE